MFFGTFDFKGISNGFWEGLGKLKTSIFAFFFEGIFEAFFGRAKIRAKCWKKSRGEILELDSRGPQAPGERL